MDKLEKKIIFSFGALSFAFIAMTTVILTQVSGVTETTNRIQKILEPSIKANLKLSNAINTSLLNLHSWVLFPDDNFIRQRQASWSIITKLYNQLANHSKRWDDDEQIIRLTKINQSLLLFKQNQETIEKLVRTQENALAIQLLQQENIPMALQLIASLRRISDPQKWEMERAFLQMEAQETNLTYTTFLFLFLSIFATTALGIVLARAVIMPLQRTMRLAESISMGNYSLDNKFFEEDEKLNVALRTMTTQLYEKNQENESQQKTLKKYNRELTKLNAELKTSNEELSQFSYRTSHDLKAPLITVRGLAEVISEDIKDQEYNEAEKNAHLIIRHVLKLEKLIVDILELAKADLEITDVEDVNIGDVILDIQEKLRSIYIDYDVRIKTELDESIRFLVSKIRLTQVLENLISNGIKYCDDSKPDRFVKISTIRDGTKKLCIVEDNGIGIPDEFTDRVFSMFQRFHPTIAYGSGLGMYIIKKHIDKMDGTISFTSSENGTRFLIEFP